MVLAAGQLVGQAANLAQLGDEHRSADGQFNLQVRPQAGDRAIVPGIRPFAAEVAVLIERARLAPVLNQADPGQDFGNSAFEFGQPPAQLCPGERRRLCCQHDFQIGVLGHALDQAVRLGQAGAATKREMHAVQLHRKQRPQRIGQVFVLFQQAGGDAAQRRLCHQRVDQFELLRAQGPHARSYWTAWALKLSLRAMRRLPVFSTMPEGTCVLRPALYS